MSHPCMYVCDLLGKTEGLAMGRTRQPPLDPCLNFLLGVSVEQKPSTADSKD